MNEDAPLIIKAICVRQAILLLFIAMTLMVGCEKVPVRGIIVKKNHRPPWTSFVLISTGKSFVSVPQYHPEQWDIVIQSDGTSDVTGEYLITLSHDDWDKMEVGGIWERKTDK